MILRLLVCAGMAAGRLIELGFSRRNIAAQGESREGNLSRRTFPLIVATHGWVLGLTALKGSRHPHAWIVAVLLLVQPLRTWALLTLGRHWNARGAVPESMVVVTDGPYRYVRHPNYAVVIVELAALPAAFRLWRLALVATAVNGLLLAGRIRDEERLLFETPGYREHFGRLPRFLPMSSVEAGD